MKLVAAFVIACALAVVPSAGADSVGDDRGGRSATTAGIARRFRSDQRVASDDVSVVGKFKASSSFVDCTGKPEHFVPPAVQHRHHAADGDQRDRRPCTDKNGWYTRPVTVAFQGTDAGSGLASCTSTACALARRRAATGLAATRPDVSAGVVRRRVRRDTARLRRGRAQLRQAGWQPPGLARSGTGRDAGIDACTGMRYAGPDTAA